MKKNDQTKHVFVRLEVVVVGCSAWTQMNNLHTFVAASNRHNLRDAVELSLVRVSLTEPSLCLYVWR